MNHEMSVWGGGMDFAAQSVNLGILAIFLREEMPVISVDALDFWFGGR